MSSPTVATSFMDRIKEQLGQISSAMAVELALYFGVALLAGIILKKAGRFIVLLLVTVIALVWLADYFAVATVDIPKIKALFGIEPSTTFSGYFAQTFNWARQNPLYALALIIGFLLGLSIG
jgi:uncharacterized membrane protein (Fun14 family)